MILHASATGSPSAPPLALLSRPMGLVVVRGGAPLALSVVQPAAVVGQNQSGVYWEATLAHAGELTVQMRTARGPRTDDFDTLLSSHVSAKERAEQPKGERRPEQPPKGYVCNCCGIEGHWIFNCPTAGTGGPPGDYVCHLCGIAGHWRNECPHNIHNKVDHKAKLSA